MFWALLAIAIEFSYGTLSGTSGQTNGFTEKRVHFFANGSSDGKTARFKAFTLHVMDTLQAQSSLSKTVEEDPLDAYVWPSLRRFDTEVMADLTPCTSHFRELAAPDTR